MNKRRMLQLFGKNIIAYPLVSMILLIATSCESTPQEELDKKINVALRNDNNIDKAEWSSFNEYIFNHETDFPDFISETGSLNNDYLTTYIFDRAERRRNEATPKIYDPSVELDLSIPTLVNVFIENSASMDGFVRNRTDFEAGLSDLLVELLYDYGNENIALNFINDTIHPSNIDEIEKFADKLEPGKLPYRVGNRSHSRLNEILKMTLAGVSENQISVLFSDCIYSLGKDEDTEGALAYEKSLSKDAYLKKFVKNPGLSYSTIILKMNSQFTGKYYDKHDKPIDIKDVRRPYYIWIIGEERQITRFLENTNYFAFEGYENSYVLEGMKNIEIPFFSILKETNKIGDFNPADRKEKYTTSINEVKYDKDLFQFSIVANLGNVLADSTYLLDKDNYELTDGYILQAVEKVDRNMLDKRDRITVDNTTVSHIFTVNTSKEYSLQNMSIKLKNKIPAWVYKSSTLDDTTPEGRLNKTFGLTYLIEGITEAYRKHYPESNTYFEIKIDIKK